jgi:hypothetical protein
MKRSLTDRMIRAARLDVNLYEEVEADTQATSQAFTVVLLSSLAAGVGHLTTGGVGGIVLLTIGALIGWYVWAYLTYFIGTRLLPEPQTEADLGQLLRTTAFSSSPGLIRAIAIVPSLEAPIFGAASLWMLVAMVIAVRQALDYTSTWRAIGVCAIGWAIQAAILAVIFAISGPAP